MTDNPTVTKALEAQISAARNFHDENGNAIGCITFRATHPIGNAALVIDALEKAAEEKWSGNAVDGGTIYCSAYHLWVDIPLGEAGQQAGILEVRGQYFIAKWLPMLHKAIEPEAIAKRWLKENAYQIREAL